VWRQPHFLVGLFYWRNGLRRARTTRIVLGVVALTLLWTSHSQARVNATQARPSGIGTREVVDETGRRVTLPAEVRRMVSLAPNLTETIYALGAGDRLAGVTDYCDYPPEAQKKPRVGGPRNPSLEAIVALKPDVVLATTALNRLETVEALARLGVVVYATDPRTVAGVLESIARLADLIGASQEGQILVSNLRARLESLQERLAGRPVKRVLFIVWEDPLITIGPHTFLADALRYAGARSVVETRQDWPRLSFEEVIRLQPDYLVFAGSHGETGEREFTDLRTRPGWRELAAVRARRFAIISDAVNRPAPRLVDAIEELARQLHPDAFPAGSAMSGGR
jgi:iron complex transport system substrate-binding protein